jgi:hypothetical protein
MALVALGATPALLLACGESDAGRGETSTDGGGGLSGGISPGRELPLPGFVSTLTLQLAPFE